MCKNEHLQNMEKVTDNLNLQNVTRIIYPRPMRGNSARDWIVKDSSKRNAEKFNFSTKGTSKESSQRRPSIDTLFQITISKEAMIMDKLYSEAI
jgi:hypothetical protein